jgi:ABC-type oligopeptide transport system ATPase subunit
MAGIFTKEFGMVKAVDDVSLEIGGGEFLVLVGRRDGASRPCCR